MAVFWGNSGPAENFEVLANNRIRGITVIIAIVVKQLERQYPSSTYNTAWTCYDLYLGFKNAISRFEGSFLYRPVTTCDKLRRHRCS